jgi:hypothetical protein
MVLFPGAEPMSPTGTGYSSIARAPIFRRRRLADLPDGCPQEWVGMTNQQLMDLYCVAVGNAVASPDAQVSAKLGGWVGA